LIKIIYANLKIRTILRQISIPYAQMSQTDNEKYFLDPITNKKEKFPSILSAPSVYLSVIVPSYFEEKRCNFVLKVYFLI